MSCQLSEDQDQDQWSRRCVVMVLKVIAGRLHLMARELVQTLVQRETKTREDSRRLKSPWRREDKLYAEWVIEPDWYQYV